MSMVYKVRDSDWMVGWCNMNTIHLVFEKYSGIPVFRLSNRDGWNQLKAWRKFPRKMRILRELKWLEEDE